MWSASHVDRFATADAHDWTQIWIIPAGIAAVVLVVFLIFLAAARIADLDGPVTATVEER